MTAAFAPLLEKINVRFNNEALLIRAITHKSHAAAEDYERLEFLGDRVLNLSVAAMLFNQFPHYSEGELAKHHAALVREDTLARVAATWQLEHFIRVGKSAQSDVSLQPSILADAVEALLGALFIDAGFSASEAVVKTFWAHLVSAVDILDPKSELQELLQAAGHPLPAYTTTNSTGKDHDKTFTIKVTSNLGSAEGVGASKQKAAQTAAKNLLNNLKVS